MTYLALQLHKVPGVAHISPIFVAYISHLLQDKHSNKSSGDMRHKKSVVIP